MKTMNWRAAKLQVQAIAFLLCRVQQPTVVEVRPMLHDVNTLATATCTLQATELPVD